MRERLRLRSSTLREVFSLVWTDASRVVRVRLSIVLLLVTTTSVLTAMGPVAVKLAVDEFSGQTKGSSTSLTVIIVLYVLSQWLARTLCEVRVLVHARAERRMFRSLSERLFSHLMRLPLRFHLNRQSGAVIQSLENGLQGYQMILHHLVFTLLPVVVELVTIVAVLSHVARPAFLFLFACALIFYGAAFAYAATAVSGSAERAAAARVNANAAMVDGLLNYETVKYFTAESVLQEKVHRMLLRTEVSWVTFYRRYTLNGLGVAAIFGGFLAATMLYATHEVQASRMTLGEFVLINSYMLEVVRPIEMLGYALQTISQGSAMLKKLLALFREAPEQYLTVDRGQVQGPGTLEFENVVLSYLPDRPVLKCVNFKVTAGHTLGIVGASGSGKSTIVRLVARLLEPTSGRILIDGGPISGVRLEQLREYISVVPQDTALLDGTIAYNIALGRPTSTREEVEWAASMAQLHDLVMTLPDRYDTKVGERGAKLSVGERQRVGIARAILRRARIYVFDEATSALDGHTEQEVLRSIRGVSRAHTTLVIAHRLSTVVHADEIIVLEKGAIIEQGTHSSLLRNRRVYARLWEAQRQGTCDVG